MLVTGLVRWELPSFDSWPPFSLVALARGIMIPTPAIDAYITRPSPFADGAMTVTNLPHDSASNIRM
jgi:hypothetical protein